MVEMEVLRRLQADGAFPYLREPMQGGLCDYNLCFLMRRHPSFRYQFAQAVGKRFLSGRIVAGQRAQLVEHHRTAQWAEQEYAALHRLLTEKQSEARDAVARYRALRRVGAPPSRHKKRTGGARGPFYYCHRARLTRCMRPLWAGPAGLAPRGGEGDHHPLPRLHTHAGHAVPREGGGAQEHARRALAGLQGDGGGGGDLEVCAGPARPPRCPRSA